MKANYWLLSLLCLGLSVPLARHLLHRRSAGAEPVVRVATFNVALHRPAPGALLAELRGGGSAAGKQLAEIVQRVQPDLLLLCEVDRDEAAAAAAVFADEYLAVGQGGQPGLRFEYRCCAPSNTGEPSGRDLDGDGKRDGPADAYGFGAFPGQYAMVLLSRHPILHDRVRTFQQLPWAAMPDALRPAGAFDDATWQALRLSSKSHWDVPIGVGSRVVHALCSHPTPPVFDGPEDRNGCRNHDEIRFWVDYLTPGRGDWIVDDRGGRGGLAAEASFVVLGDLNCDPVDGDSRREALRALLAHEGVHDVAPRSKAAVDVALQQFGANAQHRGDPACDTGDFPDVVGRDPGNLRVARSGVFWPLPYEAGARLVEASDHRLVWLDLIVP